MPFYDIQYSFSIDLKYITFVNLFSVLIKKSGELSDGISIHFLPITTIVVNLVIENARYFFHSNADNNVRIMIDVSNRMM